MKLWALRVFRRLPTWLRVALVHLLTPSYTVGAVAVLRRPDGRIAFVQQRHTPGWALPGGLMERGEGPAACVVRELAEELGVDLEVSDLPVPHAAVNERVRRVDVVFFLDAAPGTKLHREQDDVEVTRVGWFALDALPELSEPTIEILTAVRVLP